ncbi:hypothetical protein CPC08DRAFT_752315 [Agrocybe pediades]|nr:hypothetical protein CPC08DRAFT_752315 [Agrocybe pediades]
MNTFLRVIACMQTAVAHCTLFDDINRTLQTTVDHDSPAQQVPPRHDGNSDPSFTDYQTHGRIVATWHLWWWTID